MYIQGKNVILRSKKMEDVNNDFSWRTNEELSRLDATTPINLSIGECVKIGYESLFIVAIVSVFMGAVTTIQTAFNLIGPLIPDYVISLVVRDMTLLELSPTIIAIVFAE